MRMIYWWKKILTAVKAIINLNLIVKNLHDNEAAIFFQEEEKFYKLPHQNMLKEWVMLSK